MRTLTLHSHRGRIVVKVDGETQTIARSLADIPELARNARAVGIAVPVPVPVREGAPLHSAPARTPDTRLPFVGRGAPNVRR